MALRVLLADESSTIKRVMQLALQDFAVEVKAVHAGVDVLEVAKTFKPDIVFADVLLQKKNGYEVSAELKADPELRSTPVVLMWSSFMELDQAGYQKSKANGKLEKPFDVETLRRLVRDNVQRLKEDRLSAYMKFPTGISAPLEDEESVKKTSAAKSSTINLPPPPPTETVSQEVELPPPPPTDEVTNPPFELEEVSTEEFAPSTLTGAGTKGRADVPPPPPGENEPEEWVKQDISKFTLDIAPLELGGEDASISFDIQHGSLDGEKQITSTSIPTPTHTGYRYDSPPPERTKTEAIPFPDFEDFQSTEAHLPAIPQFEPSASAKASEQPLELEKELSADQLEKIIRAQSKEVIEEVVKKIVPELASKIIREELNRLIAENSQ